MNLSHKEKISALYLCADILDYPEDDYLEDVQKLKLLVSQPLQSYSLEDLQAEYIRVFSMKSTQLRTVLYASWWIDMKMSGVSFSRINDFYNKCGYKFDVESVKKPLDHISLMITFIAILLEEGKIKEIEDFAKFLTWLDDFASSLDEASDIKYFKYAVDISNNIVNSLKEDA